MSKKRKICMIFTSIIVLILIGIITIMGMKYWRTNDIRKNAKSTIDCIINSDYSKDFYCNRQPPPAHKTNDAEIF